MHNNSAPVRMRLLPIPLCNRASPTLVVGSTLVSRGANHSMTPLIPDLLTKLIVARGGLAAWQAKRVARYIDEHIGTRFKAGDLATLVQLSTAHFFRAFKASFGTTPAAYIMRQRIRFAQDLMLSTGYPLAQVALECGMCDQSHLCRAFRRVVGNSPTQWRRQFAPDPEARPNRPALFPNRNVGMTLTGE
jgi:AraC-like DNA-binding protein